VLGLASEHTPNLRNRFNHLKCQSRMKFHISPVENSPPLKSIKLPSWPRTQWSPAPSFGAFLGATEFEARELDPARSSPLSKSRNLLRCVVGSGSPR
jgi:hypothetical protein